MKHSIITASLSRLANRERSPIEKTLFRIEREITKAAYRGDFTVVVPMPDKDGIEKVFAQLSLYGYRFEKTVPAGSNNYLISWH